MKKILSEIGTHWCCFAAAADCRRKAIFLWETSYAKDLGLLQKAAKGMVRQLE